VNDTRSATVNVDTLHSFVPTCTSEHVAILAHFNNRNFYTARCGNCGRTWLGDETDFTFGIPHESPWQRWSHAGTGGVTEVVVPPA